MGALIETAGCFPGSSVYMNLKMQALNLNITNIEEEIDRVLKIVRMEDSKFIKFKEFQFMLYATIHGCKTNS